MTTNAAPSLTQIAAQAAASRQFVESADPAQEIGPLDKLATPQDTTAAGPSILADLVARRRVKVPTTPLHVNIPVPLDAALSRVMQEKGIEKTAIVIAALRPILEAYL